MAAERGKQQTFTDDQLTALRDAMREWEKRAENEGLSQREIGDKLLVSQQTYSKFMGGSSGASYMTATRIARLVGFDGVDAFFADRGVSVPGQKRFFADRLPRRELAANSLIKQRKISPEAYEAVRDDPRYNGAEYDYKDGAAWTDILVATDLAMHRVHHEDPADREKQGEFLRGHKRRARAKKSAEASSDADREPAPKSTRKRGAA